MRTCLAFLNLAASLVLGSGCVWTSDGGVTQRYVSTWAGTAESERGSWAGEPIVIQGNSGGVVVKGEPGREHITVRAHFVAGARDAFDAEAAFSDAAQSLSVELEDGQWQVFCDGASEDHGSAVASSTGCDSLEVLVPMGSEAMPVSLEADTDFGGIHASGLVVETLHLHAPFGLVADVEPVDGATLAVLGSKDLVSGMCSNWLRVPPGTGFESLSMTVEDADTRYDGVDQDDPQWWLQVEVRGMDDAPELEPFQGTLQWEREDQGGALVESARIYSSLGKAIVTTGEVPPSDGLTLCASMSLQGSQTADPEAR